MFPRQSHQSERRMCRCGQPVTDSRIPSCLYCVEHKCNTSGCNEPRVARTTYCSACLNRIQGRNSGMQQTQAPAYGSYVQQVPAMFGSYIQQVPMSYASGPNFYEQQQSQYAQLHREHLQREQLQLQAQQQALLQLQQQALMQAQQFAQQRGGSRCTNCGEPRNRLLLNPGMCNNCLALVSRRRW